METFMCEECAKQLEKQKKRMLENNPAKSSIIRAKISQKLLAKNQSSWNKGKKWNRSLHHDALVEKVAKDFAYEGYRVITTHKYIPDAILVDIEHKTVSAIEVNPQSVIDKEEKEKKKKYDVLLVGDFRHARNMERKI